MSMPNLGGLPIQRASSTWLTSASTALATRRQEDFAGDNCAEPAVAAVGEHRLDARERARARTGAAGDVRGTGQRHGFSPPGGAGMQATAKPWLLARKR